MKTLMMTIYFLFLMQFSFGQISLTGVAKEKPKQVKPYDSLENFLGNNYMAYKGQELFLIPQAESLREYGYSGFLKDMNKSSFSKSNIFKCCDNNNSKYNELAGKYFLVEDVVKDPEDEYGSDAFFKLKMKETGETVFYKYSSEFKHSFPFLVVGYYEKQKQFFANNYVLIRPFPKIEGANQMKTLDIETGEEIEIEKGKYLKCLDITVDEKYFEPSLLLQNEKGQKFTFPLYARDLNIQRIMTKEEAESYKSKFGEENWQAIINEKIKAGFTEEMARLSWGAPDKINRSSYGDQWVYGSQYLYFENGKLKSFN